MKAQMTANIRMVQKYDSDSAKGINVFCEEENEGLNPNLIGPIQLVIGGTLAQFAIFEAYANAGLLPGTFDITVDVGRGAGGKAKLTLLTVKDPAMQQHLQTGQQAQTGSATTNTGTTTEPVKK